ncbi:MAG TPA: hypothetical protein VF794_06045 [Archangium sp.]|uniref:hypothetical protein n=1 Tax=Archangium sp. TaxID=1872627 RepID=UPI002ED9E6DB
MSELPAYIARLHPHRSHFAATRFGRMHDVEEGTGRPVLPLHGNPTWSFLYRKVLSGLAGGPYRVVDVAGTARRETPRPAQETWRGPTRGL